MTRSTAADNQPKVVDGNDQQPEEERSELVFLGSGTSEGIPLVSCLTNKDTNQECAVCLDAANSESKNRRRNTNVLIRHRNGRNIVIDCGKFFWPAAMEWFPKLNLRFIHSAILTHQHSDAIFGLDDLRDWTRNVPGNGGIKVYCRQMDFDYLSVGFDYLTDTTKSTGGGGVSTLDWNVITDQQEFQVEGVTFWPFTVEHGATTCLGFKFGSVVYISDISKMDPALRPKLQSPQLLVIDCLRLEQEHPSHFILEQTLSEVRQLQPAKTLLIGMNHTVDHESTNEMLRKLKETEGLDVQLAYDGQVLPIDL